MHHLLIDACFSHGIVVLFGLSHCQLINLCAVTGGKVVHNLQTASSVSCCAIDYMFTDFFFSLPWYRMT